MVEAHLVLAAAHDYAGQARRCAALRRRPPRHFARIADVAARIAAEAEEEVRRRREELIEAALRRFSEGNPWLAALREGPYPRLVLLAFVEQPPQVTIPRLWGPHHVHPGSYIAVSFIPVRLQDGRVHRPLRARVAFSAFKTAYWRQRRRLLERYPHLARVYESSLRKYEAKGYPRGRAEALAFRDVFRVLVGVSWLLWVCLAVEEGAIGWRDVPLPYALAREPRLHADWVSPPDVLPSAPSWCTWSRLVEEAGPRTV